MVYNGSTCRRRNFGKCFGIHFNPAARSHCQFRNAACIIHDVWTDIRWVSPNILFVIALVAFFSPLHVMLFSLLIFCCCECLRGDKRLCRLMLWNMSRTKNRNGMQWIAKLTSLIIIQLTNSRKKQTKPFAIEVGIYVSCWHFSFKNNCSAANSMKHLQNYIITIEW